MTAAEGLVLRGPLLTSLDPHRARAIEDGFVRIAPDGRIAGAGDWGGAAAEVRGAPVLRVAPALILPAFVDAHVHLPAPQPGEALAHLVDGRVVAMGRERELKLRTGAGAERVLADRLDHVGREHLGALQRGALRARRAGLA